MGIPLIAGREFTRADAFASTHQPIGPDDLAHRGARGAGVQQPPGKRLHDVVFAAAELTVVDHLGAKAFEAGERAVVEVDQA